MNEFIAAQCDRTGEMVALEAKAQPPATVHYTPAQARELAETHDDTRFGDSSLTASALRSLATQVEELQAKIEAVGAGGVQRLVAHYDSQQLRTFYGVQNDADLIEAQARHIAKLQVKLGTINESTRNLSIREG